MHETTFDKRTQYPCVRSVRSARLVSRDQEQIQLLVLHRGRSMAVVGGSIVFRNGLVLMWVLMLKACDDVPRFQRQERRATDNFGQVGIGPVFASSFSPSTHMQPALLCWNSSLSCACADDASLFALARV